MCNIGSRMSTYRRIARYFCRSRIRNRVHAYTSGQILPTAALAECTCPEFCERDHDNE